MSYAPFPARTRARLRWISEGPHRGTAYILEEPNLLRRPAGPQAVGLADSGTGSFPRAGFERFVDRTRGIGQSNVLRQRMGHPVRSFLHLLLLNLHVMRQGG